LKNQKTKGRIQASKNSYSRILKQRYLISIKLKPSSHIAFSDALFLIVIIHRTEAAKLAIIHQDEAVKVTEINRGAVFLWIIALTVFGLAVNFGFSGVVKILHRESKTEYRISLQYLNSLP
jgi:hypothetical protein